MFDNDPYAHAYRPYPFSHDISGPRRDELMDFLPVYEAPRSRRGSAESFKAAMEQFQFPLDGRYEFTFTFSVPLETRDAPVKEEAIWLQSEVHIPTELSEQVSVFSLKTEVAGTEQAIVLPVAEDYARAFGAENPTDEAQVPCLEERVTALPMQPLVGDVVLAPAPVDREMAGPYVSEEGVQGEDEYEDESDDEDEDDDEDEQSITSATASASTCAGKKRSHSELSDDESDSELSDEGSTATLTGKTSKRPRKKRDDALFAFEQQCKPRSKTYTHPQFNDLVCRVILGDGSSCEVVSNTIQACFKHRDFHFGKRFACAVCDKSYGHMYCLKRHVKESPCRAQAGKRSCKQWEISMNNMRWMKPGWLRPRTGRGPA